jgi:hypothetical protein
MQQGWVFKRSHFMLNQKPFPARNNYRGIGVDAIGDFDMV